MPGIVLNTGKTVEETVTTSGQLDKISNSI